MVPLDNLGIGILPGTVTSATVPARRGAYHNVGESGVSGFI